LCMLSSSGSHDAWRRSQPECLFANSYVSTLPSVTANWVLSWREFLVVEVRYR
jgi:hypothetical protein